MSFIKNPTVLLPQTLRYGSGYNHLTVEGRHDVWAGVGEDKGLYAFQYDYEEKIQYLISQYLFPYYEVVIPSGDTYYLWPVYGPTGRVYRSKHTSFVLYQPLDASSWTLSNIYPFSPRENPITDDRGLEAFYGDRFWTVESLPDMDGRSVQAEPHGEDNDEESKITFQWPRWRSSTLYGVYKPVNNTVSGEKIFGVPRFSDQNSHYRFYRSAKKDGSDWTYYYCSDYDEVYGVIRHDGGKWIMTFCHTTEYWYEGDEEPNIDHSVTFKFCKKEYSHEDRPPMILSFDSYGEGYSTQLAALGGMTVCR